MTYVIEPAEPTTLAVEGGDRRFPVRRVYCVGRNYAAHAREMGHDPDREPPFFFMKPADAIVPSGAAIAFPPATDDLHHEIELVVAIGHGGSDIAEARALDHVFGYGLGIDLTRRDIQALAKKMGRPWDMAKGFDRSAPMAPLRDARDIGHPETGRIWLAAGGETRQEGDLSHQIWKVPEVIAYLSGLVTLQAGDLIMTGTPEGVSKIEPGTTLTGGVEGVGEITVTIG